MPGGVAMQSSSADTGLVAVSEDAVSGSWDGSVAVMPKVAVLLCTWFTGGEACGSIAMGGAPCRVCNDVSSNSTGAAGDAAAGSDNGGAVSGEGGRALSMTFSPETASSWTGEKASVPGGGGSAQLGRSGGGYVKYVGATSELVSGYAQSQRCAWCL